MTILKCAKCCGTNYFLYQDNDGYWEYECETCGYDDRLIQAVEYADTAVDYFKDAF